MYYYFLLQTGNEVSLNRFEIGGRKFLLAIVRDITERKEYEEALKNSELRFRLIAENTADVIMALDMSLYITYVSPSVTKLNGYTPEECLKIDIFKFLTPKSGMKVKQILEEELIFEQKGAPPGRTRIIEVSAYHKNGSIIWLELLPSFLRDEKGNQSVL